MEKLGKKQMNHLKYKLIYAMCLSTFALMGCRNDNSSNTTTPTLPMTALSGTAAVGSPIANAQIDLKCNGYSKDAAATTNAQGNWSSSVPTINLPCATLLTGGQIGAANNNQKFYSITTSTGSNIIVNITPLSNLILAKTVNVATGASLENWYTGAGLATSLNDITSNLQIHIASLLKALKDNGYTMPSDTNFNPLSTAFTAETSNSYDQLLEQFAAAVTASSSATYEGLLASYLGGGTLPTPATPAVTTPTIMTCANKNLPVTTLTSIADYSGDYKDSNGTTLFNLTTNTAKITAKGITANIQEVCGPNTQSNGTNHVLITDKGYVTLFKDNAGKYSAESSDFSGFYGEKSSATTSTLCESSGVDDKLGFKNAPSDFCSFTKSTSVAITSPDTYTFFNADKKENVKVTVVGTSVTSVAIENNSYSWACGTGTLSACSGVTFSSTSSYKQVMFNNTNLDVVFGATQALTVKNGLLIHSITTTPPVTPPTQVFAVNTAACTVASSDSNMNLYWQCHENIIQDMNLSLKTLTNVPCNLQKVGSLVSVTSGGKTISDSYNADYEDLTGIPNPTGPLAASASSLTVKTYGVVEINMSINKDGTFKSVIATQTSPFLQISCLP